MGKQLTPELTLNEARALLIVNGENPIRPGRFAEKMWPDSECWKKSYKCGPYGASRGAAMSRTAGGYLGRLAKKGLLRRDRDAGWMPLYYITLEGKRALSDKSLPVIWSK